MGELMATANVTMADFTIAFRDELAIEAEACGVIEFPGANASLAAALRKIDLLKIAGTYEVERQAIREMVREDGYDPPSIPAKVPEHVKAIDRGLQNLFAGLRSPDPDQRRKFEALFERLRNRAPYEAAEILDVLEKAKLPKRKPRVVPPWRNHAAQMDKMRLLVAEGYSIPAAARSVAAAEGRSHEASRARYFERLYRQKIELRQK